MCTEHKTCSCARHRPSFGKRTSGFFWKTLPTSHNNQPNLVYLMRRRKHDLVDDDDGDGRKTKTMYAAFVPRSYGCSSLFILFQYVEFLPLYLSRTSLLAFLVETSTVLGGFSKRFYHTNAHRTRSNHLHPGFFFV